MNGHAEFGLLDEYVLGTLDGAEAEHVRRHLATCAACRTEYDELRSVIDLLPHALPLEPAPKALRDRIFAEIDPPARSFAGSFRMVTLTRGLAAALLLAVAGDAFFAIRLGQRNAVAVAASPAPSTTRVAVVPLPPAHPATLFPSARPVRLGARPATPAAGATAGPTHVAPRDDAADRAAIRRLARELAAARLQTRVDRARIHRLQVALADARVLTSSIARTPAPIALRTAAPVRVASAVVSPASVPSSSPASSSTPATPASGEPVANDDRLVDALRTGKVYALDGAIGAQPWHLTIVQPRDGRHALVYSGTPDAPQGQTYRTWVVRGGQTVSIGELPPGKPVTLEMPMALEPGDIVAFSREPVGVEGLPTTPFLMQLKISPSR